MNNTRNVQNLNISLINNENVQIGCNNTLVVVRGIEDDNRLFPENNNKTPHISEITLLSGDEKSLKYRSSGPTCISIGNNCTIAELVLNKELLNDLRTGQFTVTKGDNLLSITWYDDNLYQSEQVAADHKAIKIRFSEGQDIHELEKQVFELLADCKDKKLVQLITELLSIHKARLKHINMGCIELEVDLQSDSSVSFLDKKEEIKDLLRRTIIPEGAVFDIELQSPPPRANADQPTSENFENQNINDVTIGEKDLAPESNKDDFSLLEAGASSSSPGYKKTEDKDTVDKIGPSSSFSASETSEGLVPYIEPLFTNNDVLIQYMVENLDDVSERCKTVIQLELIQHLTSEDKILTRVDESKSKINKGNILQKLDTEFEQFYIDLNTIIQLEVERERKGSSLSRYEDLVTTVSQDRRSVRSKHTTLERTTSMETLTGGHKPESSGDITDIIINKIEEQFQMTTDRCREEIRIIIERQGEEIPKWENKEDKTEPITSQITSKEFENLMHKYKMKRNWRIIERHIDQKVNWLKPRLDSIVRVNLGMAALQIELKTITERRKEKRGEKSSTSRLSRAKTTPTFDSDMNTMRKKHIREIEKEETHRSSTIIPDLL